MYVSVYNGQCELCSQVWLCLRENPAKRSITVSELGDSNVVSWVRGCHRVAGWWLANLIKYVSLISIATRKRCLGRSCSFQTVRPVNGGSMLKKLEDNINTLSGTNNSKLISLAVRPASGSSTTCAGLTCRFSSPPTLCSSLPFSHSVVIPIYLSRMQPHSIPLAAWLTVYPSSV
jgi:hypothetical protein